MWRSVCSLSVLVRRCFLAREEEAVYRGEKQDPVWVVARGEADPCLGKQPKRRRGGMWESEEEEEDIVFSRVKNYKKTKDRVAVLQVEDAAETDLLKKLEEEGIPDVPQGMSTNTQLFCVYDESEAGE